MSRFDERFETYAVPQQQREHGYDVTLRRGNLTSATFIARKFYERRHEDLGGEIGVSVRDEFQAWLLPIASCVLANETVIPQLGDCVMDGDETWKVHPPDNSTPAVEKVGEYDWRVHTRLTPNA